MDLMATSRLQTAMTRPLLVLRRVALAIWKSAAKPSAGSPLHIIHLEAPDRGILLSADPTGWRMLSPASVRMIQTWPRSLHRTRAYSRAWRQGGSHERAVA